jgi:hypothetical protein
MRHHDATLRDLRSAFGQDRGDVLVREAVKPVAPHALFIKA